MLGVHRKKDRTYYLLVEHDIKGTKFIPNDDRLALLFVSLGMSTSISRFQTYADVESWLNARPQFSKDGRKATDFRPAKMVDFCSHLGHPERRGNFVHVAGTNGKGSTCAMIASVYQTSGYNTGLYTSPHVEHWRERIKVNGDPASEDDILRIFRMMDLVPGFESLTYFELGTVAAFLYFAEVGVDIAVMETGMGGRLDATNILIPIVSVITSIGLDHTDYLGNTLGAIAYEKAGIIKPGIPVVVGDLPSDALHVVRGAAELLNTKMVMANDLSPRFDHETGEVVVQHAVGIMRFRPDIQSVTSAINAAMAISVIEILQDRFVVNASDIRSGLEHAARNTGLLGRMERLLPNRHWYYDGAHNQEALNVLLLNVAKIAPVSTWTVVFTMMADKVSYESLKPFQAFHGAIFWRSASDRGATESAVIEHLPEVNICNEDEIIRHLAAMTSEFVIFTGSFYFYNEVRRWIRSIAASEC